MNIDPWILGFSLITVVVTVWMGFRSAKKSKTASDFFVAGRSVSVGWNASAISGEYLSAASFMGVAGMVMSVGYDALWYPVCYACGYLFLLLFIAGPLRRFGAYTVPDFAEGRFDSPVFRKIAVVFVLFIGFFYTMPQMKGAGTTLSYIFQDLDFRETLFAFLAPHNDQGEALKGLNYAVGVMLVGAVITLNVALGGMKGITLVQAVQYWVKMFAISVPIFVLMAVYGPYGAHLRENSDIRVVINNAPSKELKPWIIKGKEYVNPEDELEIKRQPLPPKAPSDDTWLNPFGPLTTKAAKAANAAPRWNLSPEIRARLVDFSGQPPATGLETMLDAAERFVEGKSSGKAATPPVSQFADWTNMPPNTSRSLPAGFPMLSTLREYGLLLERPVLVATNLPRPKLILGGSFQTRDEFLKYLEVLFLTNGVRLDLSGSAIKALPATDWERYQNNPASVTFVPNRIFSMRLNAEPRVLVHEYGELIGARMLLATNLPQQIAELNPNFEVMLADETRTAMEMTFAASGISLIPAGKEVWVVPTAELKDYRLPPIDPRPYSLLYTYSLIIALVCGTAGLPHILVRFYTNPDGAAAKRTTMWVMILIGVFYVFPPVFGVMGRNLLPELYSGVGAKGTDKIVLELPRLLNEKVPMLGSILSGITCAGAFAAFMSTFSGLLVSMTGALAHDVYGRILRPGASPAQRMRMFKFGAVLLGTVAVLLGTQVEKLEINFMVGQAFAIAAASYFPLLFMCAWWRGMTMKGAATGMLTGGLLAVSTISLTSASDLKLLDLAGFWAAHPLLRILCEQPALWAVPLAITLMIVVSKLTRRDVPPDIRMKMLVLHAPEKLGLKQEYIQEHQPGH